MLISRYPMMLAQRFEMRLKVPGQDSKIHYVDFSAMSLWSREDVTPGSYDTGFALITPSPEIRDMIDALHHYFSFRPGAWGPSFRRPVLRPTKAAAKRLAVTQSAPARFIAR